MQAVDLTTIRAAAAELRQLWIPARVEKVIQRDRYTISLALRTFERRGWLDVAWHPQAARVCIGSPPPRTPDTFTFSDQLRHQLGGFALTAIENLDPWERVLDFQFAKRPGDRLAWHLYVEIIGKYSNVVLTDADDRIVTVAHQVTASQSSVRTVETGQVYEAPPALTVSVPKLSESFASWQERVSLVPGAIKRQLLKCYRGLSPNLIFLMLEAAQIDPNASTASLNGSDWERLFILWQEWLNRLEESNFEPGWTASSYTVVGWGIVTPVKDLQALLDCYYTNELNQQEFKQSRHQLLQKVGSLLKKLRVKADNFRNKLKQSDRADRYRQEADLLMAHLHLWQPGMKSITLDDFETGKPIKIALNPEKNAVQNAQLLYKQNQKLKRARIAVEPLLAEVMAELNYLEQVEASLSELEVYQNPEDLETLAEIREELISQAYLEASQHQNRANKNKESSPHRYISPSGFELWVGRNNSQNDRLSFRTANDYDLWFHTQEIPGSHALLRLEPGAVPDEKDLQFAADLAAYHSRARQSDRVPVVYTKPKHVYKPKGAKPGMAIYKQETVIWGRPQMANLYQN
ncbi:MAG: NFACT family protein [Prochloraceae cyanobacterium]|nr:NFACT family protein [Prochloraceae cyanobacterium]